MFLVSNFDPSAGRRGGLKTNMDGNSWDFRTAVIHVVYLSVKHFRGSKLVHYSIRPVWVLVELLIWHDPWHSRANTN